MTPASSIIGRFAGVHAVLYALFDADERLDRIAMREQVRQVLAAGVDGVTVLGLATEVQKLDEHERHTLIDWAADDIDGRVPLSVTATGNSVAAQIALARHAQQAGANWIVLQPPAVGTFSSDQYIRFFGRVAESVSLPVAIQNAPAYLGRGLSAADIDQLTTQHPNINHLKSESSAVELEHLIELTEGRLTVLNGRAGLEMIDCLAAGCDGFILAPDVIDYGVAVQRAWHADRHDEAQALYLETLGAITFVMQSVEHLVAYGKRLYMARCWDGVGAAPAEVFDRAPYLPVTDFGLDRVAHWTASLAPFGVVSGAVDPE